jgi:hypothetical protein
MGTLKTLHHSAETRRRTGLVAIILAGALLGCGAPARAAGEPVATAPIPPPPAAAATPMVVPLSQRASPAPPKTTAPKTAAPKLARPAEGERKHTDTVDRRKPPMRDAASPKKQADRSKIQTTPRERHAERQPARVRREQPRLRAEYRPPRYYYREYREGPPFPPPWYDRGPPFAAMPYPRGMMPPW